ncbi:MAG: hypothetical protein ACYC18_13225, partial [Gammaproteobacteria bacterium]
DHTERRAMPVLDDIRHGPNHEIRSPVLDSEALPLAAWYARPLNTDEACALQAAIHARLHHVRAAPRLTFAWLLWRLVARFWLGRSVEADRRNLPTAARDGREQALGVLVYGQLQMSRKLRGASEHLDAGFHALVPWLTATEYFRVLNRHERLSHLVLGPVPAPAQDLATLMLEAAVIRRLAGSVAQRPQRGASRSATAG